MKNVVSSNNFKDKSKSEEATANQTIDAKTPSTMKSAHEAAGNKLIDTKTASSMQSVQKIADKSNSKEATGNQPIDTKIASYLKSTQNKFSNKSNPKEASASQPIEVKITSNMKSTKNSCVFKTNLKEAAASQPIDAKTASNNKSSQNKDKSDPKEAKSKKLLQNEKPIELKIDSQSVEVNRDLKNAGSSKIDKIVVVPTINKPVENTKCVEKITESVSIGKEPNTENELDSAKNNNKTKSNEKVSELTDSGIIADKSLDSSVVIINDENVEKSSNDQIKIKNEFKTIDLSTSPEQSDGSSKTFKGTFEFLNDYFEKSNEYISSLEPSSSIDLTQTDCVSDNQQKKNSVEKPKEDTLFDMVKKRAADIRKAETGKVTKILPQEPKISTSTKFPLCFNSSSSSTPTQTAPLIPSVQIISNQSTPSQSGTRISQRKRSHSISIELSDSDLSPVAKKKSNPSDFLKVNIVNDNVPNGFITEEQERQIVIKLTAAIDRAMVYENIMPKFEKCISAKGFLMIVCADVFSKKWLEREVPKLVVWKTSCLRVVNAYFHTAKLIKAVVYIPGAKETASKVLQRLCRMNPGLSTIGWRIYNRCQSKFGETMTLGIDEISLANLKLINYQPYYGLTRLDFQIV